MHELLSSGENLVVFMRNIHPALICVCSCVGDLFLTDNFLELSGMFGLFATYFTIFKCPGILTVSNVHTVLSSV